MNPSSQRKELKEFYSSSLDSEQKACQFSLSYPDTRGNVHLCCPITSLISLFASGVQKPTVKKLNAAFLFNFRLCNVQTGESLQKHLSG